MFPLFSALGFLGNLSPSSPPVPTELNEFLWSLYPPLCHTVQLG